MMNSHIAIPKDRIEAFCHRNHIRSLAFFGSVLRRDFGADSDIDVLIEFQNGHTPSLLDLIRIEDELSGMFAHKVDLVERKAVEESPNYIRRRHILESAELAYVAG